MTKKQMVERVRQNHPNIGATQIRIWLDEAMDAFCRETQMIRGYKQFTTDDTTPIRYNSIDSEVIEITGVDFDGYEIPRLVDRPEKRDLT
tara:strand:+ start:63 stop:332 length:270 start_codon:yes stop_codon:yes gene_type:complete